MNKFNRLLRLMSDAAYYILITVEFILGVWVAFIPAGLFIYFYTRAWNETDPILTNYERFNQTNKAVFWETILILVILIVIRKIVNWVVDYAKSIETD